MEPHVHCRIHKYPPPVPIHSLLDLFHAFTFRFLKIHLNIIFPSTAGSCKWPLSLTKYLYATLQSLIRAICTAYLIFFDLITRIKFGEQCRSLSSSLCSFLHSPVTSSLLGPNILRSTLISNTFSLCSFLNVGDHYIIE